MVAQRIAFAIVTLFIVSLFIYLGVELLPGDADAPADLGNGAVIAAGERQVLGEIGHRSIAY